VKPDPCQNTLYGRLLAGRDEPTVVEKEALWERLDAPSRARRRWRWLGAGGLAMVAATAALLLFVFPPGGLIGPNDEFAVRGGERALVRVTCLEGAAPAPCGPGAILALELKPPEGRRHLAAYLDGETVVWLTDAEVPAELGPLPEGFRLPDDLDVARTKVVAVFSAAPIPREELEEKLRTDAVTVIERPLAEAGP
jgi:hypothetical protein